MPRGTWGGIADPKVVRMKIQWQQGTSKCQTGFHLRAGTLELADAENAVSEVVDWVTVNFRTLLMDTDTLMSVDGMLLDDNTGFTHAFANVKGTIPAGTQILPGFVTAVVNAKGELRRKYGQGRMLWPVRSDGYVDGDTMSAGGQAAYQGVVTALADKFVGDPLLKEYVLVNAHAAKDAHTNVGGTVRPAIPASWYDVTALQLNTSVSMLESRKAGRGS